MMPYGQGRRLGESIDPRLMQADFSGYANAGMIQGQALANMGKQIGDVIKQRAEQKKQDAVDEKFLQQGSEFFKGTPLETTFADAYQNYTSEDMTPRDKRALATSIRSLIPMGVEAHKMRMAQQSAGAPMMIMTPQEVDHFSNAGYALEIVGRNPDGSLAVKDMTRKAAGGTGGLVPFYNEQTGTFGMQQAPPQSFPPTPGAIVNPALIQQAAQGFTQPSLPVPAGSGASDALLPTRVDAGVSPPVATTATGMVPNADFFAQGGKEAVRVPGSMRDLEAQQKQQQIAKAKMEMDKAEVEKAAKQQAEISKQSEKLIAADTFFDDVDRAIALLDRSSPRVGVVGGVSRQLGTKVPGTTAYDLQENYIKPLTSQIMLASLSKLKESSPTGASGLGALNQSEADSLRESWGAIKIGGDPAILRENLLRIKRRRFDLIHGTKEERDKALQKGKITQQEYDIVDRMEKQTFPSEFSTPQLAPTPFAPDVEALINKYTK